MLGIPEIIITYAHHWCDTSLKVVFYQNCPYSCQWWWWFWWSDLDNAVKGCEAWQKPRVQPGAHSCSPICYLLGSFGAFHFLDPNFVKSVLINQSFMWIHLRKLISCGKHLTKDMRDSKHRRLLSLNKWTTTWTRKQVLKLLCPTYNMAKTLLQLDVYEWLRI